MTMISFDAPVHAGIPAQRLDGQEEQISLDKSFVPRPQSTFLVESTGDSMLNAFIAPGSKLVVDRSLKPQNGDIVLAELNGEFTIRFLRKNEFRCWLVPANKRYREIEVFGDQTLLIRGVVTTIITEVKCVRGSMI